MVSAESDSATCSPPTMTLPEGYGKGSLFGTSMDLRKSFCASPHSTVRNSVTAAAESEMTGTASIRNSCLLYTSDAADDLLCVDLGGRRIIKKKTSRINDNEMKII